MSDEATPPPSAPKPPRKYIETGEPENKGLMIVVGIACVLVFCVFGYFMFFHFHDMFFQKVIVEK